MEDSLPLHLYTELSYLQTAYQQLGFCMELVDFRNDTLYVSICQDSPTLPLASRIELERGLRTAIESFPIWLNLGWQLRISTTGVAHS